jgi:hypothetical protein
MIFLTFIFRLFLLDISEWEVIQENCDNQINLLAKESKWVNSLSHVQDPMSQNQ